MAALYTPMKLACLVLYAVALASLAGLLPANWRIVATIAAVGLVAHTLEILFVFKYVRRYQGPLASSVLLTLLFGFLHWKPIADRAKTGAG